MRGERLTQLRGLHGSYRYGLVLMLALASTGAQMLLPDTRASWLVQALLACLQQAAAEL